MGAIMVLVMLSAIATLAYALWSEDEGVLMDVQGSVHDEVGLPMANATLKVGDVTFWTDDDGRFAGQARVKNGTTILASAPEHFSHRLMVTVADDGKDIDLTLVNDIEVEIPCLWTICDVDLDHTEIEDLTIGPAADDIDWGYGRIDPSEGVWITLPESLSKSGGGGFGLCPN